MIVETRYFLLRGIYMSLWKRLIVTAIVLLVAVGSGFASGGADTDSTTSSGTGSTAMMSAEMEAPMLAEMVAANTLPPLEERLPIEPLVLDPVNEIGKYGGTISRTYLAPSDSLGFGRLIVAGLLQFTMDGQSYLPNVAKDYSVSSDGLVYTFYLREGMKWSDGEPLTTGDVVFWYEDVVGNTELSPAPPNWFVSGGEPGKVEAIDDYTFRVTFVKPNAFFLREVGGTSDVAMPRMMLPKHYMTQFHAEYTDKAALDKMVGDANLDVWTALWGQKASYWNNPDLPILGAWQLTNEPGESRLIAVRNPYYFKVDPQGRQLPYVDRVVHDLIENPELILLKASNGELDFQFRHLAFDDYPLLKENESKGNYTVLTHGGDRASHVAFWPNMSIEDPVYHELMNSTEFKKALMYAIDRDELNELFYFGLGEPRAITSISSEPTYEADVAQMNIKYDPDEANRILDSLGYDKRDSNGIRLGPDGKPIFFLMPYATAWPYMGDIGQVVLDYWKEIGIDSLLKPFERSVFYQMSYNNEIPLTLFTSPGTSLGNAWWIFPKGAHNSWAYGRWYATGGAEGIEPPEGGKIRMAMDLYDEALTSANFDDVIAAIKQILRWGNEEIWGIGLLGEIPAIGVVSNNMGNVAVNAPSGTHLLHPANLYPEQWYLKN